MTTVVEDSNKQLLSKADKSNKHRDKKTIDVTKETSETKEDEIIKPNLTPDQILSRFYKHVLSWDASKLVPNVKKIKEVKVSFKDTKDYVTTFEPLIFEECRAQLERSIEEGEADSEPCLSRVRYLTDTNDFLVVGLVISHETELYSFHDNDLMMLSVHHPRIVFGEDENTEMSDEEDEDTNAGTLDKTVGNKTAVHSSNGHTIIVDEDPNKATTDQPKKKKLAIPKSKMELTPETRYLHLIGTVEHLESGGIKVKFYTKDLGGRFQKLAILLRHEMDWWTTKLCNLSTLQREFLALHLTSQLNFMKTLLLRDEDVDSDHMGMKIPPALQSQFESTYNPSQFSALNSALDAHPITLIQGPPGTGKTHVILGLISVLLHSTIIPKHPVVEKKQFLQKELTDEEKQRDWTISQPWYFKSGSYKSIRDDLSLIDYQYEEKEDKRKKEFFKKIKETGSTLNALKKRKILLCAPSNGAVDEIVTRLLRDGLLNEEGKKYNPNIVRVGPGSHADVDSVALDSMVRAKQQLMSSNTAIPSSSASTAQATSGSARLTQDSSSIRNMILADADIVATTLSFSGSSLLTKLSNGFDIVIIDEAAQAVETSTLIPMQHHCKKIVLVGDPKQLPATIISPVAIKYRYDQSLFERLQVKTIPTMLDTQYRMHSKIRQFPSDHFYDGLLKDGPNIPQRQQGYHQNPFFGPMVFYDLSYTTESKPTGGSVCNFEECKMVYLLYQLILKTHPGEDFSGRIGVISPYKQQVLTLREYFKSFPGVSIDTVDGFQGREKEIIIFSCVRAPEDKGSGIGFLADVRRMNVAITRPRSSLIIVGNSRALSVNPDWNDLIKHAKDAHNLIPVSEPIETTVPTFTTSELYDTLAAEGFKQKLNPPKSVEEIENQKKKKNKRKLRSKKNNKNEDKHKDNDKEIKKFKPDTKTPDSSKK
ncbi:DNA2/NAM7 helicase family protein [Tieghemostelium lacteum]|uniref:DNA2/NAM7 helicase family protein n=1 Tax=Tieghemostelium lacteum TaxID=361077 RepID=A0A152A0W9_TIELA|nr:DNA2/NAM7 helicase family protein [Tieghemostelium lacteum]|eukprot:KYQ99859.1 DNA2/NAM7 helicase family protein [Tieghemostelium lacteum]